MSWQVENIARYVLSLGPVHVNLTKLPLGSDILLSSLYSSVEVVVCTWTESRELGHPVKLCGIYGIYGHIWYLWVPVRKKQVLLMSSLWPQLHALIVLSVVRIFGIVPFLLADRLASCSIWSQAHKWVGMLIILVIDGNCIYSVYKFY